MIDFHCHLDLYPDPRAVLAESVHRRCFVLAVTTTPLAWEGTTRMVGDAPRVRVAAGLHPEVVATRYREVDRLCALVRETRYVGEIGLDGSPRFSATLPIQREALRRVLAACVEAGGRVLTLHSRGAASALLDEISVFPQAGLPVLHWFSGTQRELTRAVELGCWFSVGPAMLRTRSGTQLAAAMPRDRVLTETDGPFARRGSEALVPWDVLEAEEVLANLWSCSIGESQSRLRDNLRRLAYEDPGLT